MRDRHARALTRFLTDLEDEDAGRFIAHLANLVAAPERPGRQLPRGQPLVPPLATVL